MRIAQLRYFLSVAQHRNFTKAAEECHIAQPAMSQQIQSLEQELGFRLFDRSHQDVELTRAGEAYLTRITPILKQLERAHEEAKAVSSGYFGKLNIGIFGSTQSCDMKILTRFHQDYPGIILNFKRAFPKTQAHQLIGGEIDLSFSAVGQISSDADMTTIVQPVGRPCALAHESHPLAAKKSASMEEIAAYPNIFSAQNDMRDPIIPSIFLDPRFTDNIIISQDVDIAWLMMRLGLGVLIVPESVAAFRQQDIRLITIIDADWDYEMAWTYMKSNENPALRTFIRYLADKDGLS